MNSGSVVLFLRISLIFLAAVTLRGKELQIIATGDIHGRMYDFVFTDTRYFLYIPTTVNWKRDDGWRKRIEK